MSYQRDFEKTLNVAVVGVGAHGYRNVLLTMTSLPVKLEAFCDINIERAELTAKQLLIKVCYNTIIYFQQKGTEYEPRRTQRF